MSSSATTEDLPIPEPGDIRYQVRYGRIYEFEFVEVDQDGDWVFRSGLMELVTQQGEGLFETEVDAWLDRMNELSEEREEARNEIAEWEMVIARVQKETERIRDIVAGLELTKGADHATNS